MAKLLSIDSQDFTNLITNQESLPIQLNGDLKGYGQLLKITVNTPNAATFTAAPATDLLTSTAHGFTTGLKGQVTNSGGGLPAGLSGSTDYFVVVIDANTYKLATSLANATAAVPTVIDITTDGTGTQTFTPTAIAGATYKVQVSAYGTSAGSWHDLASATNITASTDVVVEKLDPMYNWIKLVYTITAGRMNVSQRVIVRG